jgi:protoporphyrinogen oxidase
MFVVDSHCDCCPSSVAPFSSLRVSKLHWIDATISELGPKVEYQDKLFSSLLEAVRGGNIALVSAHRRTFAAICAALWNSLISSGISDPL